MNWDKVSRMGFEMVILVYQTAMCDISKFIFCFIVVRRIIQFDVNARFAIVWVKQIVFWVSTQ